MPAACINAVCYDTIAEAIDASLPDDIVRVEPGVRAETLTVDHDLSIFWPNDDEAVIHDVGDGQPIFHVIDGADVGVWNATFAATAGRVFEVEPGSKLSLVNSVAMSSAIREEGAIGRVDQGTLYLSQTRFQGGTARAGGQLYLRDSELQTFETYFTGGQAIERGGAVAVQDSSFGAGHYYISADFDDDHGGGGGAVHLLNADVDIENSRFSDCGGTSSGGALYAVGSEVDIRTTSVINTSAPYDAAITAFGGGPGLVGRLELEQVRISGGTGGGVQGKQLAVFRLDDVIVSRVNGEPDVDDVIANDGVGIVAENVASTVINRSYLCGNHAGGRALAKFYLSQGLTLTMNNTRFAFNDVSAPIVEIEGDGGIARIQHNDLVENVGTPLVVSDLDVFLARANIITGHDQTTPLIQLDSAGLSTVDTNLFWDNSIASLSDQGDGVGFVGDPELRAYDESTACTFTTITESFAIPGAPFATWRSEGRDRDENSADRDGTTADIGAGGGPLAFEDLWIDHDRDGYPLVYDCPMSGDPIDDALVNPGVADVPYDGVDADCDLWYDFDADRDEYVSDAYGGDDCDDVDPLINPSVPEIGANDVDENCDGSTDGDGDGFEPGTGPDADCDDLDPTVFPGRSEEPDTIDQNCDGIADVEGAIVPVGCSTAPTTDSIGGFGWIAVAVAGILARRRIHAPPRSRRHRRLGPVRVLLLR